MLGGGKALRYPLLSAWRVMRGRASARLPPNANGRTGSPRRVNGSGFRPSPAHVAGGSDNPLGARALYLGDPLYRIHGTNEPWKLGGGCLRRHPHVRADIIDLYNRAKIGATVIVQR